MHDFSPNACDRSSSRYELCRPLAVNQKELSRAAAVTSGRTWSESGECVFSEAFRPQDGEANCFHLQNNMIQMKEDIVKACQVNRDQLNREMAFRLQPLPDDVKQTNTEREAWQSTDEIESFLMTQPIRRPGPDIDDFGEEVTMLRTNTSRNDELSSYQQPRKPIRGFCQVCFDEISSLNSVSCISPKQKPSHSFCKECLKRYVQEWVFGGADYLLKEDKTNTLPCMSPDGCEGYIPHGAIESVCSAGLWENYQEKVFRMEAIGNMHRSDKSPLRSTELASNTFSSYSYSDPAEVIGGLGDDEPEDTSFRRQGRSKSLDDLGSLARPLVRADACQKVPAEMAKKSARMKSRTSHDAREKRIYHVESPTNPSLNKVAEAMTEAKVRKCPLCDVAFLKESGCNKMKCPGCKIYLCYICRLPVKREGYGACCPGLYLFTIFLSAFLTYGLLRSFLSARI